MIACGVPVDDAPRRIAAEETASPRGDAVSAEDGGSTDVTVFLAESSRLAPVHRRVQSGSVTDRLDALVHGPTDAESETGLRTAIGPDTRATHLGTTNDVASIDLSRTFVGVGGEEQILAVAQIVFTATEATGVSRVQFSLGRKVVAVPTEDGTLSDAPIGRDGFSGLVAT